MSGQGHCHWQTVQPTDARLYLCTFLAHACDFDSRDPAQVLVTSVCTCSASYAMIDGVLLETQCAESLLPFTLLCGGMFTTMQMHTMHETNESACFQ